MLPVTSATLLAPGALDGRTVAAGGACALACAALGAAVVALPPAQLDDDGVAAWARAAGPIDVVAIDAGTAFGGGGLAGLRACVDGAWRLVRGVALSWWLGDDARGGKLVLVAPRAGAGEHARAALAALENLARSLAVEWARFGVRATVVGVGRETADEQVGALVAFLASRAGDYYSGCRFDLR